MTYDFDTIIHRRGSGCYKWDECGQPDVIPMWVADMDFQAAPPIRQALQRRLDHGVFGYTLVTESYYRAIQSWFERRHQWHVERSWIMYTSGVVPALSAIVKAFTQPGDGVVLLTPVYNCFFSSVRNNGCEAVECSLECSVERADAKLIYTIDFDSLDALCADPRTRLLVLCNPHNPVGRVWTRRELQRVAQICRSHDVVVVSDEIHCELCYEGRRYVPFGTIDMENAIVCTSPSKSFNIAGLQNANIICSRAEWRAKIDRAINQNEVCDVNPFGVVATEAAYDEGEPWLDALCHYLWLNYQALLAFFADRLPQLPIAPLEGTYLVWVDTRPTGLASDDLAECLLREGRVQVNSGTMYGQDGFVRLNIACPRSQMMEGLNRLASVVAPLLAEKADDKG